MESLLRARFSSTGLPVLLPPIGTPARSAASPQRSAEPASPAELSGYLLGLFSSAELPRRPPARGARGGAAPGGRVRHRGFREQSMRLGEGPPRPGDFPWTCPRHVPWHVSRRWRTIHSPGAVGDQRTALGRRWTSCLPQRRALHSDCCRASSCLPVQLWVWTCAGRTLAVRPPPACVRVEALASPYPSPPRRRTRAGPSCPTFGSASS